MNTLRTIGVAVLLSSVGLIAEAGTRLQVNFSQEGDLILKVDPVLHQRFGLAYPVTYILSIPGDLTGFQAFVRPESGADWTQLPRKYTGDYFNGIDAVRFDDATGTAYVSATFPATTDELHIRITDSGGMAVPATFGGVAKYYDNREAAVVVSIDDWKDYTDALFTQFASILRSYHLPYTTAVITGETTDSTWAHIQAELDAGDAEAAAHTRTHARWPYSDVEGQVAGARLDLLEHLTMPARFRKGTTEYVYSFLVPFGETSAAIETTVTHAGYLNSRVVGFQNGEYTPWDTTMGRFRYDGTTREMGSPWGSTNAADLNASFDARVAAQGIYHLLLHPYTLVPSGEIYSEFFSNHLGHISGHSNLWYTTFGHLYVYRLMGDSTVGKTTWPETPPIITGNPASQVAEEDQSVSFSCIATGTEPLTFQWQRDGGNLTGATAGTLTLGSVTRADSGASFRCIVRNPYGVDTSTSALLSVITLGSESGIVSDDFNAVALDTLLWTVVNPLHDATISVTGGGTDNARLLIALPARVSHDLWDGILSAPRVLQPAANTDLSVVAKFDGALASSIQSQGLIIEQDSLNFIRFDLVYDAGEISFFAATFTDGEPTTQSSVEIEMDAPYYLRVRRSGDLWTGMYSSNGSTWTTGATFTHQMQVHRVGPWAGNTGTSAPAFTAKVDHFTNTFAPITGEDGPDIRTAPSVTADPVSVTRFQGDSASFSIEVSGTGPFTYRWQRDGSNVAGGSDAALSLTSVSRADSGAWFRCIVSNGFGRDTSGAALLHVMPLYPATVTCEPADTTVFAGRAARFSIAATGTAPLTYRWQKNGTDIPDSQDSAYVIPVTTTADSGAGYRCIVTNPGGTDTSRTAVLHVVKMDTVKIVRSPTDTTVYAGKPAAFSVAASGTAPLVYRWQKNGTDISGAIDSVLTLAAAARSDSGTEYRCIVVNAGGSDTSGTARLHVLRVDTAMVIRDPVDTTAFVGTLASFSITARGTAPMTYQWQKNGTDMPGSVDSAYTIPVVAPVDSGSTFRCIVTNMGGSDTSAAAVLSVVEIHSPPTGLRVDLHAFLEGAMIGDTMRTDLQRQDLLPRIHPFASLGWVVSGADSASTLPSATVDWVLVELREGIADSTIRARRAGLMLKDGSITDMDGESPLFFSGMTVGSYYIVIRHRNHLPIMSATPVAMDSSVAAYDFRTASSQSFDAGATLLSCGKYGLIAGSVNRNRGVGATDLARVRQHYSTSPAYLDTDCDMDGTVTASDLALARINIGRIASIR